MFGLILTPFEKTRTNSPCAEKLIEARDLIKQGWCRGVHERDWIVGYFNPKIGKQYCILGALGKVSPEGMATSANEALEELFKRANRIKHIAPWNDKIWRTKGSVLRAFNRAIKLAEKEHK